MVVLLKLKYLELLQVVSVHQKRLNRFRKLIDTQYKKYKIKGAAKIYEDFDKLIENSNIDGIVVSTPDHWHAIPSINAMKAGKHVYCEKPMSHTIQTGESYGKDS